MKKRLILMLLAALTTCGTALWAQDAAMKTRMAEIRKCYAEALQLAEKGMKDASKNLIHVEYDTTDPNWKQHYTIDYFFDNKQKDEYLGLDLCHLVLARQKDSDTFSEYLFDKNSGNLLFCYLKRPAENDGEIVEIRSYYSADPDGEIWSIVKHVDKKSGKVLWEDQETDTSGPSQAYRMDANNLKDAFEALTRPSD